MSRSGKILALLLLLLGFILGGCSLTPPPQMGTPGAPPAAKDEIPSRDTTIKYLSSVKMTYLVANPLNLQPIPSGQDTIYMVDGLANKAVQDKINERLESLYKTMREVSLPPYRGIKVSIPDDAELEQNTIHTEAKFSYNNLLSLVIWNNKGYRVPGLVTSYIINVTALKAITFDLYTGDEIRLGDLFRDDVDYVALLNNHIATKVVKYEPGEEQPWWIEEEPFELIAPFRGVGEKPKFYLLPGGISLVFDYATPEINTHFHPVHLPIFFNELEDVFSFIPKYATPESLYTGPVTKKELIRPKQAPVSYNSFTVDKVRVETSINSPQGLPQHIEALISQLSEAYQPWQRSLVQRQAEITFAP